MPSDEWRRVILSLASTFPKNAWVNPPGFSVYVRAGDRWWGGLVPTLEIANITSHDPGKGHFRQLLPEFEAISEEMGRRIFVENVSTPRFRAFWEARGYATHSAFVDGSKSFIQP